MNPISLLRLMFCCTLLAAPFARADDGAPAAQVAPIPHQPQQQFDIAPQPAQPPLPAPELPQTDAPALSGDDLRAKPALLYQALTSSVILNNTAALRELLPLYRALPEPQKAADALVIPAAEAALARADGRHHDAVAAYRRIVAINPDLGAMRFLLAQSLFDNRQYEAAEDQFTRLKSAADLSDGLQKVVDIYLDTLQKQQKWHINGGISYVQDNNLNNVSEGATLKTEHGAWSAPKPESGKGVHYHASARRDWRIGLPVQLRTELDSDGRVYFDNHNFDEHSIKLTLGGVYQNARTQTALLPFFRHRWYGGSSYQRETGLRAEWMQQTAPRHRLLLAAESSLSRHPGRPWLKGSSHTVSANWLFVQNPRRYWLFGSDYARRNARDNSHSYHRYGIRAGITQEWQRGLSTSLHVGAAQRRYDAPDLFNIRRSDKEYHANVSVWHRNWSVFGLTPKLVLQWHKTDSNNPLYSHSKQNAFIELNKTF